MRSLIRTVFVSTALVLAACSPPPLKTDRSLSASVEITPLKTYSIPQSRLMLWLAGVNGIGTVNAVDCYRVVYVSSDGRGKPTRLSGLLALPHGKPAQGLVSFQHGTTSDRSEVPSNLSTDGLAAALVFAGNGFAAIAPDYLGLGISSRPQSYFVAADTARAVIDLLHAARHVEGVPSSPPFLIGFSEGGYASLAAQRVLEQQGEKVLATASIAGAFNLRSISIPWALTGQAQQDPIYLTLWVRGYANRYGHPLSSVFVPKYAKLVPLLLDTPHDSGQILAALPKDPRELFLPEVLRAIKGDGHHWLADALSENEMADWKAVAPIRLYYGSHDVDVPPLEATFTAHLMTERGSDVRAINVGAVDHNQSVLVAAPMILQELEELAPKR
jgi:pimeloyl-ACP methyl ester carboxylesterase